MQTPPFSAQHINTIKTKTEDGVEVQFTFAEKNCPIIELKGKLAKICADLQSIIKDLELTSAYLSAAEKILTEYFFNDSASSFDANNSSHVTLSSLMMSATITYWKCFASSENRSGKIPEQKLKSALPCHLLSLHKSIQDTRNNYVAHGGKTENETYKTLLVLHPTGAQPPFVIHHTSYLPIPFANEITDFRTLVEYIKKIMSDLLLEKSRAMNNGELPILHPLELYAAAATKITYHQRP